MTTMEQYGSMEDEPIKVEDRETDLLFSTNDGSISTPLTIRYGKFITITAVIIALVGSFMLLAHSRQNGEQIPIFSDREVGNGTFEGITTTSTYEEFDTGSVMGSWSVNGTAYIANTNNSAITYSTPTPNGLSYSCMLQAPTGLGSGQLPTTSSIQKNFTGIVIGSCYSASFYNSLRYQGHQLGVHPRTPTIFNVILGGNSVYSTVPSITSWVQVTTIVISAVSTSMSLEFQITSCVGLPGELGLDGVTLSTVACPTSPRSSEIGAQALPKKFGVVSVTCEYWFGREWCHKDSSQRG